MAVATTRTKNDTLIEVRTDEQPKATFVKITVNDVCGDQMFTSTLELNMVEAVALRDLLTDVIDGDIRFRPERAG